MPGLRTVRQIAKPGQTSPSRPMLVDQLNPSGIDRRQIRREERPAWSARTRTLWLFNCCWDSDGTMDQARETELLSRALEHLKSAIELLDDARAPGQIAAYVDLAAHQLREAVTGQAPPRSD